MIQGIRRRRNLCFPLRVILWTALLGGAGGARAAEIVALAEAEFDSGVQLADTIWRHAEMGYLEEQSSSELRQYLAGAGFRIDEGVADIPTAFVATYGTGKPVIGILAEFDALPGLSQAALPERSPLEDDGAGHACGHHLFGAASVTAGVAVANWLAAENRSGTVRVYGTPAEEGGSGKVYMTRAGLFDDVDVVLHWHPGDKNSAAASSSTANKSGRFTFHGVAAHAASAPDRGRSALDGVEAMNFMVNLMREHVPSDARIHYVITDGGDAPNIVPETAQVYYYVRHPEAERVVELFERVVKAAEAGAMGTGTRMEYEVMHGNYPVLPNETLARLVDGNLRELGGFLYDDKERDFAAKIRETLPGKLPAVDSTNEVQPFAITQGMGSTDVGDVSWNVPTVGFTTATWVPGTPAHSWQAVAAGGTSIGHKGMGLASRLIARTAKDLIENPELIDEALAELREKQGSDFEYRALLGDREPPLDYRL
jgi:aminobenzoyl-glutamate utilization protein B